MAGGRSPRLLERRQLSFQTSSWKFSVGNQPACWSFHNSRPCCLLREASMAGHGSTRTYSRYSWPYPGCAKKFAHLDGIEIGTVGRQVEQRCPACFDDFADAVDLGAARLSMMTMSHGRKVGDGICLHQTRNFQTALLATFTLRSVTSRSTISSRVRSGLSLSAPRMKSACASSTSACVAWPAGDRPSSASADPTPLPSLCRSRSATPPDASTGRPP